MVQFTGLLVSFSLLTAAFSTPLKRTVAQVEADLTNISNQVTALDNQINAFPNTGGSLAAALAIHSSSTSLDTTLNSATTDVNNTGVVGEADGRTILNMIEAIEPKILDALTVIARKEPAFAALPIGGIPALILQDLKNLQTATIAFSTALITNAPADLRSESQGVTNTINAAFNSAIAAYS
ncbi:hydrophobic surface binding protein [Mycena rebaudengoi]|nr:hydrophobic surface binding protein [Mycena rebaudengoi]